ncbi:MAG: hypothetical protein NTZ04_06925 [Chloroflexi bacterium]|nr:hypothetical protein [Chloroflexota bacterium]
MKISLRQITGNVWPVTVLRLALGVLFVVSAVGKLQHQDLFIDAVLKYGMLPDGLARFYGTVLPWAELFIGCSLVLGIFSVFASAVCIPLIASFTVANIYALFRYVGEACDCLGGLVRLSHPAALAIDIAMLLVAALLLYHRAKANSLGLGRFLGKGKDIPGLRGSARFVLGVTIIVIAMIVAVSLWGTPKSKLDTDIDSDLQYEKVVVVFFRKGNPAGLDIIMDLEQQYQSVSFRRVNCEQQPNAEEELNVHIAVEEFNVHIFPTTLVITGKKRGGYIEPWRLEGPLNEADLIAAIDEVLASRT